MYVDCVCKCFGEAGLRVVELFRVELLAAKVVVGGGDGELVFALIRRHYRLLQEGTALRRVRLGRRQVAQDTRQMIGRLLVPRLPIGVFPTRAALRDSSRCLEMAFSAL